MNNSLQMDWNHLRAFLATAEQGSLSAAARHLGLTQPTLSRQVAALEQELGVLLFERVGRTLVLTQLGADLLEHTRPMGLAATQISLTALGQSQSIEGLVRITASDVMSAFILPDLLRAVQEQAPKLRIDVVAANDIRDLMRREADIAIRHVRPDQPDLIARLVQEAEGYFYASKSYLDRAGRPASTSDLADHDFIGPGDPERMIKFLNPLGIHLGPSNFRLQTQSGVVAWEYVKQGFGISPMSAQVGRSTPGIEQVLPAMPPILFPVWLTCHRELHTSRRIRLVFDLLSDFLSR
ncbi:MAG: LysR family transcriptional regulator [Rhodobacteraceae bacterium]|nr:LysR family transcriptional regulator [Paracoccaceae bacterium]